MIEPQLLAIAKQKANDSLTLITQKVIEQMDYDDSKLIFYHYDENQNLVSISYNTKYINEILNKSLKQLDASLTAAYEGKADSILNEVFYKQGIIYEVSIGYLTRIAFLQDYGYRFKIGLRISSYVNGNIEVKSEPYGINNTFIKVFLNLKIRAKVITSIYRENIEYTSSIPIIMQVVQGEVGNYQTYKKSE